MKGKQMNSEKIVDNIIDEAYAFICESLAKADIKFDAGTDDCIFYNDEEQKKTFVINLWQHQCEEYEGD